MSLVKSLVLSLISVLTLSSCDRVRPLYDVEDCGTGACSTIDVAVISNKLGQRLRNRLQEYLRDVPVTSKKKYKLFVSFTNGSRVYFLNEQGAATRNEITHTASFVLKDSQLQEVVKDSFSVIANRDTSDIGSQLASTIFTPEEDALVDQLAMTIVEKLRVFFTTENKK